MNRLSFSIVLVLATLIFASATLFAQTRGTAAELSSSAGYYANSQWVSGKVESVEKEGKHTYIRINGILYRTMPNVDITRKVYRNQGAYDEVPAGVQDVHQNSDVMLRVQGFRIYQILIME